MMVDVEVETCGNVEHKPTYQIWMFVADNAQQDVTCGPIVTSWDGSQDSKLPLHASHVALPT